MSNNIKLKRMEKTWFKCIF